MKSSWKTTAMGVAAILTAVANVLTGLVNGTPVDFMTAFTSISAGVGLLFARDNNKTSEDVGVK